MTMTHRLKSRVKGNFHARFGTGREAGDCLPDQNYAELRIRPDQG
jgi:hypothetical protein